MLAEHAATTAIRPLSATPVVAVAGLVLILAVLSVLLMSFLLYRRSGRR